MEYTELLIMIIWFFYGLFSAYQAEVNDHITVTIVFIIFSPLIFIIRVFYGVFDKIVFKNF